MLQVINQSLSSQFRYRGEVNCKLFNYLNASENFFLQVWRLWVRSHLPFSSLQFHPRRPRFCLLSCKHNKLQ